MKVYQMAVGGMGANAYIACKEGDDKAFVVDPGAECGRIIEALDELGIDEVTHIFLTHGHFDHIGAAADLKRATGAKVCIHERDLAMLSSQRENLAALAGMRIPACEPDIVLKGGEVIEAAGMDVKVLHTPGHSGGSVCYLTDGAMFAGDTLFYLSIGRVDLPGSDPDEYVHTLGTVLRSIDKDYTVYTGHGPETTLFFEFRRNPFLKDIP